MKTNPVKIYFTLGSSLIWITPSAALHQRGEATRCRAICCCSQMLKKKKKVVFFTHGTWWERGFPKSNQRKNDKQNIYKVPPSCSSPTR